MPTTTARVPLGVAQAVAASIIERIADDCERIEIAGSVRRGVESVGDLELVAIPKVRSETVTIGLFEEQALEVDQLADRVSALIAEGVLMDHPEDKKRGQRYAKLIHVSSGLQLDLFAVRPPASWGVIFLIRTGPASFSHSLVTLARKRALHVADGQLHVGGLGCGAYVCEVVPTPEEADVFTALRIPWQRPADRS